MCWVPNRGRGVIIPPGYCLRGGVQPPLMPEHQLGPHAEIPLPALLVATGLCTRGFCSPFGATHLRSLRRKWVLGPTAEFLVPALPGVRSSSRATCFVARGTWSCTQQHTTISQQLTTISSDQTSSDQLTTPSGIHPPRKVWKTGRFDQGHHI